MPSRNREERIDVGRRLLEEALPRVRERTLPLVVSEKDGRSIDTIGSGVPILVNGALWVVTAAHVAERLEGDRILTVPLSRVGRFRPDLIRRWRHPRNEVDLAAFQLSEDAKSTIASDKYVPIDLEYALAFSQTKEFEVTRAEHGMGVMVFGGYPGAQARADDRLLKTQFVGGNTTIAGFGRATPFPHRTLDERDELLPIWFPIEEAQRVGDWSDATTDQITLKG